MQLSVLLIAAAGLSAFMNNVAALAIAMPAVAGVCQAARRPVGAGLMPLAFATRAQWKEAYGTMRKAARKGGPVQSLPEVARCLQDRESSSRGQWRWIPFRNALRAQMTATTVLES